MRKHFKAATAETHRRAVGRLIQTIEIRSWRTKTTKSSSFKTLRTRVQSWRGTTAYSEDVVSVVILSTHKYTPVNSVLPELMKIRSGTSSHTAAFILKHVLRAKPAHTSGVSFQLTHSNGIAAVCLREPDRHDFVPCLVENPHFGEERVDGESEGSLEGQVIAVFAFGSILEICEIGEWKRVTVVIEEVAGSHGESSIIISPYFGRVLNTKDAKLSIGSRKPPISIVLNKRKRVVVSDAEVRNSVDVLLGRPKHRDPILGGMVLVEKHATDANDGSLVDSHHHLIVADPQLTVLKGNYRLVVIRNQGASDDRKRAAGSEGCSWEVSNDVVIEFVEGLDLELTGDGLESYPEVSESTGEVVGGCEGAGSQRG